MPIPKSTPQYIYKRILGQKHEKKPDTDNLIKLYMDCLDGIFYIGDQSVQLGECLKIYSETAQTVINLEECAQELSRPEQDFVDRLLA